MKEIFALLTVVAGFLGWLAQRRLEIKMGIFNDAVKALIFFEVDATNRKLQDENYMVGENERRFYPFLRDETLVLTGQSIGLVNAFFSQEASRAFDKAINSVSLEKGKDGPKTKGLYSTEDRKTIINNLNKELSILFMIKECFYSLISCTRLNN